MFIAERPVAVPLDLMEQISHARRRSDALFEIVRSDSLYERPIPERHRIIFYVGHLEAFDWNLLHTLLFEPNTASSATHAELDRLFAFGIDPVGGGLPTDVPVDWPALEVVRGYVRDVRTAIDERLASVDFNAVRTRDGFSLATLLSVAIEHRLMHVETLAYMLHRLPLDRKIRAQAPELNAIAGGEPATVVVPEMVSIPGGSVELGLARGDKKFGWDNEYEAHTVEVPAFEIDRYEVTNREYLQFLAAGGYENRALWSEADWEWKNAQRIEHPAFWEKHNNRWHWRGMFELIPFDANSTSASSASRSTSFLSTAFASKDRRVLDWPVYVSHAEASAFARWAGKSLPTEEEWQRAAYGSVERNSREYPWGNEIHNDNDTPNRHPHQQLGNFDFRHWDPTPVNAYPHGRSAFGVDDFLGNGWEWTSTVFAPFPGFEPFPFYRGYSADFFDGKHYVIKGGSPRTAACMLRPSFRNWFQAHYQFIYTGFRCVSR